jgi:hypothetical protein
VWEAQAAIHSLLRAPGSSPLHTAATTWPEALLPTPVEWLSLDCWEQFPLCVPEMITAHPKSYSTVLGCHEL